MNNNNNKLFNKKFGQTKLQNNSLISFIINEQK